MVDDPIDQVDSFIDLGVDIKEIRKALKKVDLEGYKLEAKRVKRSGLSCTQILVKLEKKISRQTHRSFSNIKKLIEINSELWFIEDNIRDCERKKQFDQNFVVSIYLKTFSSKQGVGLVPTDSKTTLRYSTILYLHNLRHQRIQHTQS